MTHACACAVHTGASGCKEHRVGARTPEPEASGVSAFGVLAMERPPAESDTSQAQPEPNCVTAAVLKSLENSSNEPKAELIASRSLPQGSPPPSGFMLSQKKVWSARRRAGVAQSRRGNALGCVN